MSMVTYPLNNIEYTAEDAELFHSTRTSGVYATDSFDYSVTGADNSIVIGTGIAWIKNRQFSGKVVAQKEPMSLDMGLPDPTYPRIDAVVIQFNSNKNATEIVVKNGAASSFPIAPEVVRTESLYELHLYHVRREAGSLSISAPNITDLRNNYAYCGLMSDSITQAVDSTLSKNGVAADAAAVGNALEGKAPAGYGLGEQAFNAPGNDANQITKCGFFRAYVNTPTGDWWTIQQEDLYGDGTYMIQKASCFAYAFVLHAERMVVDGKFYEWEWVNPPMAPGVEYRTTERWNGNVVYTKLVNCGTAINDATVTLEEVTACVRFIGYLSYTSETAPRKQLPIWNGSTIGTGYHAEITQPASPYGINQFIIKTDSNADGLGNGGYNWYVHAWYTKD